MDWHAQIFRYCERGTDAGFWAEPLNAATNAAFIVAAILAALELARRPDARHRPGAWLLVALLFAMGIGSFLFHTYATRWAGYADTLPIGLFMLAYLAYALRRFLRLGWAWVALGIAGFVAALKAAGSVSCSITLISAVDAARGPCLNGSAGYVPALVALVLIAAALVVQRHPAALGLAAASLIFLASITFRTLDWELCQSSIVLGHRAGTHFLWHLLNACLLYVLARTAIRHGPSRP
ncbi:MAG: ceramidase domain-containing protein [Hyphomicrobium sp.]